MEMGRSSRMNGGEWGERGVCGLRGGVIGNWRPSQRATVMAWMDGGGQRGGLYIYGHGYSRTLDHDRFMRISLRQGENVISMKNWLRPSMEAPVAE